MILIIGASGNLGQHILHEYSSEDVILTYGRSQAPSSERIIHFQGDLMDLDSFRKTLDKIFSLYSIDRIIYNSAFTEHSNNLSGLSALAVQKILGVNFLGYLTLLQKIESISEKYGQIKLVYISSNSIKTLNASNSVYISSKAAAEILSLSTTKNLAEKLIINIIRPGLMNSEMTSDRFDSVVDDVISKTPIKKLVSSDQVAKAIFQILENDLLVGQIITVDGGRTI